MANFIIRVELHEPLPANVYGKLNAELANKGLTTTIAAADGTLYRLPTATHHYSGNFTAEAVRDWISAIVEVIHKDHWVLVTTYSGAAWRLKQAK